MNKFGFRGEAESARWFGSGVGLHIHTFKIACCSVLVYNGSLQLEVSSPRELACPMGQALAIRYIPVGETRSDKVV
jgi:hypothetical protein